MLNLKHDTQISITWFRNNGMEANPHKFQLLIAASTPLEQQTLQITDETLIKSEPFVKVLGVIIDERLCFSQHISACCSKAARQLNALSRISKQLDSKSKAIVYRSFVASNFTYCNLVWHFCGKTNNNKLEKIQERALRIVYDDYVPPYSVLLKKSGTTTVLTTRLRSMLTEVYKIFYNLNAPCLDNLFQISKTPYSLRDPLKLIQPKRNTTNFGIRTLSYIGPKLWNNLPLHMKLHTEPDIETFKSSLKNWDGPDISVDGFYV